MASVEEKILKLRDKRTKLQGKIKVVDARLVALQGECRHPTTRKISWAAGGGTACIICNKNLG